MTDQEAPAGGDVEGAAEGRKLRTAFNRRRGNRGRRGKRRPQEAAAQGEAAATDGGAPAEIAVPPDGELREPAPAKRSRSRRRRGADKRQGDAPAQTQGAAQEGKPPRAPRAKTREPAQAEPAFPEFDWDAPVGIAPPDSSVVEALPDDSPKLHKVLADAGMGSRREMEELIVAGRVSVNGQPAHVGQRIGAKDQVRINGRPIKRKPTPPPPRVLLYHKPAGEICTRDDPDKRPTVFDRLPKVKGGRWISVGRLDFNTEGLLVFTTSGDIANKLMHPRYGWEREYAVRVLGRIDDESRARLLEGVDLEDGSASVDLIEEIGGDGANCWYRLVISEGRNREVRRLIEAIGLTVSRLVRVRFGPIGMPRRLARSRWSELSEQEVALLMQAVREAAARARATDPSGVAGLEAGDALETMDPDDPVAGDFDPHDDHFDDLDDDDLPDDAQPLHLSFESDDVDPRFRKLSPEQLEDEDWQPDSADAHQEGITQRVKDYHDAMKTPGISRRAQRRAEAISWGGGPMDGLGGDEPRKMRGPGMGGAKRGGKGGGKSRKGKAAAPGAGRKGGAARKNAAPPARKGGGGRKSGAAPRKPAGGGGGGRRRGPRKPAA